MTAEKSADTNVLDILIVVLCFECMVQSSTSDTIRHFHFLTNKDQ